MNSYALQHGVEAFQRGDLAAARRLFEQAIGMAKHNLAVLSDREGDHEAGIRLYREALESDPDLDESAYALALTLLREGRYAEAWPLHERRRNIARLNLPIPKPHWPEWQGEVIAGKRVAVLSEQGLGDQIMFARFLPALRDLGAEVVFMCQSQLTGLLGGRETLNRGDLDVWCHLMSLPFRLGTTLETLPPPTTLPVARRGGGGVGVMVAGNPGYGKDAQRSPPEAMRAQMLALGRDLRPETTGARDFLDTAEIVAELDLVITVDTSVAHLAGSLGVETWILLPAIDNDWRWLRHRTDSPWYPSARLFRLPVPGDWDGALRAVAIALAER